MAEEGRERISDECKRCGGEMSHDGSALDLLGYCEPCGVEVQCEYLARSQGWADGQDGTGIWSIDLTESSPASLPHEEEQERVPNVGPATITRRFCPVCGRDRDELPFCCGDGMDGEAVVIEYTKVPRSPSPEREQERECECVGWIGRWAYQARDGVVRCSDCERPCPHPALKTRTPPSQGEEAERAPHECCFDFDRACECVQGMVADWRLCASDALTDRDRAREEQDRYKAALEHIAKLIVKWGIADLDPSDTDKWREAWANIGHDANTIAGLALAGMRGH